MPLSDHEQRLLDQIERALYAEDPKFASNVRATDLRTHLRRRLRRSAALFVFGFALVFVGLVSTQIWISIVGFVLMVFAAFVGLMSWKRLSTRGDANRRPRPPQSSGPLSRPTGKRPAGPRAARPPSRRSPSRRS